MEWHTSVAQPRGSNFDPVPMLVALADANVDFVVIGGVAGGAHGSAYGTEDLDVVYARASENLDAMAIALERLSVTLRGAPTDLPFQVDARTLSKGTNFTFDTALGSLDILAFPTGAPPYEQLRAGALEIDLEGRNIRIASLDHLIAMKEAAARTKDLLMASELRDISDALRRPPSDA